MRTLSILAACSLIAVFQVIPTRDGVGVVATKCMTVRPSGPRSGDAGIKYFDIQGKDNQKYASFGIIAFEIPKELQDKKVKSVTLTLVQSIPKFARDGAIRFFMARDLDAAVDLKFDPGAADGVGSQIKALHALGSGNFRKLQTGKAESFKLTLDESARGQIARGGKLYIVIVPADATVAATYFGASETEKEKSPRLTLNMP
jgi:hypothetical protein